MPNLVANPENRFSRDEAHIMFYSRVHTCYYILGEQKIAKFNEADRNTVQIHIGLFRLPQYETDILISFNDPINIG